MRIPLLLVLILPFAVGSARRSPARDANGEVQAVLDSMARDLTSNNRAALVARYDKRGVFFLGNWGAELVPFDSLPTQIYGSDWKPPARFTWHNVHVEALGAQTSIVYAQFVWWTAAGDSVLTSYTGVFVKNGRNWRIRSEHESPDVGQLKRELCPKQ